MILHAQNLTKRFGDLVAVDDLSFEVEPGEVFGLLGPNGAGKTTTIRMILDIIPPDSGHITVLGGSPAAAQPRIGYLPEERGLYRNIRVLDMLVYLAELKGADRARARERALEWLARMGLEDRAGNKVKDLSRGMQQRLQVVASIIHDPDLVFLDEPFQGLDPVNVERVKGVIADLRREGKTVVLSTHQMNLVEVLCDRILLVNRGRSVLYGPLADIKRQFAPHAIRVRAPELPLGLPGVVAVEPKDGAYDLSLAEGTAPRQVLRALLDRGVDVQSFEVAPVPLEEIFVRVVTVAQDESCA
ncbi:MAG: ATP-binding cassette domain-containing protein [Thermoflexales bacterium]|nr:ATP-binding cassette domain-containing protein [Thermoflexales bacterium]